MQHYNKTRSAFYLNKQAQKQTDQKNNVVALGIIIVLVAMFTASLIH